MAGTTCDIMWPRFAPLMFRVSHGLGKACFQNSFLLQICVHLPCNHNFACQQCELFGSWHAQTRLALRPSGNGIGCECCFNSFLVCAAVYSLMCKQSWTLDVSKHFETVRNVHKALTMLDLFTQSGSFNMFASSAAPPEHFRCFNEHSSVQLQFATILFVQKGLRIENSQKHWSCDTLVVDSFDCFLLDLIGRNWWLWQLAYSFP